MEREEAFSNINPLLADTEENTSFTIKTKALDKSPVLSMAEQMQLAEGAEDCCYYSNAPDKIKRPCTPSSKATYPETSSFK